MSLRQNHEPLSHDLVERQIKDIISRLHQIMVQVSAYDTAGRPSRDVLSSELKSLSASLSALTISVNNPNAKKSNSGGAGAGTVTGGRTEPSSAADLMVATTLPSVPPELVQYVENSRNPDIYTREFVELARRWNQIMRGKQNGFARFRDVLAEQISLAMPELREDAARIVESSKTGVSYEQLKKQQQQSQ